MSQGLEAAAAEEWLDATLNNDATLAALVPGGIWNTKPEPDTIYPLAVYQFMSGIDLAEVSSIRIWTNMIYLVKAIADGADFGPLNAAVARIDALLHRASGTSADGTIWACVRQQAIRTPDDIEGRQFRHSGALYRIYAT